MATTGIFPSGEAQDFVYFHHDKSLAWARDFMRTPHGLNGHRYVHVVSQKFPFVLCVIRAISPTFFFFLVS